ncbi:MAG: hypothetical protein ACR2ND_13540 [Solirubrobacteraceae bacterium]
MSALAELLRAEGGLLGELVRADAPQSPLLARLAGSGPRAQPDHELVVAAIYEGYLLHYAAEAATLHCEDRDLALLAGDRLYALGLERLVALGDVEAVLELADVISLSALAHAREDAQLAGAVWEAGAVAVGWGSTPEHRHAKSLAWAGDIAASAAMRASCERPRYS